MNAKFYTETKRMKTTVEFRKMKTENHTTCFISMNGCMFSVDEKLFDALKNRTYEQAQPRDSKGRFIKRSYNDAI